MNERGKSDSPVVPAKPPNKAEAAEVVEERGLAEGNTSSKTRPGRSAGPGAPSALERVREVARRDKGPVDRLRQQLRRSVQCAEREPRDYVRRLVRVPGCDRQHAEHARRNVGLFLGQPAETGDPLCGIVRGLRVELGRSEGGALERERRAPVGGAEAGARPVEHLQ